MRLRDPSALLMLSGCLTLLLERGFPEHIRMDNGPEFIAEAIKEWCRRNGATTSYIDPGSPWQNPYVDSFNSRARDEVFAREVFDTVMEAKVIYRGWRNEYNNERPHSSLNNMTPAQFFSAWRQRNQKMIKNEAMRSAVTPDG